ncbi:MAG: bifunctional folylpolyglutamate synthase/dihydrofolate synthase, partial [Peptococcaceae bacterium]|nr:bifunctional folylpolyglutamate synthase/dihydrofolate synthase [Peptococcaceae bacterium]
MNNRDSFTDMPISFEDAIAKVSAVGIEPGLEAITELLRLLGNPQRNLAVIHVTGTNGKGSVCAMLESILREAGFRTGLYTSPHMIHYNERFRINGESIGDDTLMALLAEAGEAAEGVRVTLGKLPTEFEILTAMAFLWFSRENVDALVLEVGLGGRYDATNVFPKPLATIITNVTMDHEGYLGDTTAKIAWEKAGIIKEGVPLITACDDQDALQVIQKEFSDVQGEGSPARLWQARGKCHWKTRSLGLAGQIVDLATPSQYYENIELPLPGQYQCVNLACAALVWELLVKSYFPALNMFSQRKLMKETLQKGITSVSWPCRLELVQEKPDVVLDGSHNPDGLRHLAVWLSEHRHLYRQVL